jgi:hypothetical protein
MATIPATAFFAHRYCDDGTIESICMECFVAVSVRLSLKRVLQDEAKHICQGANSPDAL